MEEQIISDLKNIGDASFIRAMSVSLDVALGDVWGNAEKIIKMSEKASLLHCNLLMFQPLTLTGYACGSLFLDSFFIENAKKALFYIAEKTKHFSTIIFLGLPIKKDARLYNAISCVYEGKVLFINTLFSHSSYFFNNYIGSPLRLEKDNILFGSDITLKLTFPNENTVNLRCSDGQYPNDAELKSGIELVFSSLPTKAGEEPLKHYSSISKMRENAILFSSPSITETVGHSLYSSLTAIFEKGELLTSHSIFNDSNSTFNDDFLYADIDVELLTPSIENFDAKEEKKEDIVIELNDFANIKELKRLISTLPFISFLQPSKEKIKNYISSLFALQMEAINVRLKSIGIEKVVLGVSGGLDSTMALLFCIASFKKHAMPISNIYTFTMPCFGTTKHTKSNAISLSKILRCNIKEISIKDAVMQHFKDIEQEKNCFDVTFENAQARERTQVLMDKANQLGAIVLGSSDLSEIALGFSTFNGDHIAMYNVNASIPKTILRLCLEYAIENTTLFLEDDKDSEKFKILLSSILKTPISPELLPSIDGKISQKTEQILGSYNLQDFFIYHVCFNHYSPKKTLFLATKAFPNLSILELSSSLDSFYKRFFKSQFKRNCSPEGINSTGFSLSNWEMPSNISDFSYFLNTK